MTRQAPSAFSTSAAPGAAPSVAPGVAAVSMPDRMAAIRALLSILPGPDTDAQAVAVAREPTLTKPPGSLGRLEELALWLCGWQASHPPRMETPRCVVFAGNHGVAALGVSAFPAAVTALMVQNFQQGGAAINQLCRANGVSLDVVALDLDRPTADFTEAAAMSEADFVAAFAAGMAEGLRSADLLCLGEMGIANTTSAAAVCLGLFGGTATDWTGPGTGVQGSALDRKAAVVAAGVARHGAEATDALDLLRRVGGRELVAMAGAIVGARLNRVPVMLDGYICTAAAAALHRMAPDALDHCVVGHASQEPGHRKVLQAIGQRALLDLDLRLGEASGAVTAVPILRAAAACHAGMATFAEAGIG